MEKFVKHSGSAVAIDLANIDTDQIIPKQFLKRIERTGYGEFLFFDWRFTPSGDVIPDFVLNDQRNEGASILIAGENFGCGSSREHAPWSLFDFGFRVIIAPSFADIFYNNSLKTGLLPIVLDHDTVGSLIDTAGSEPGTIFDVDLDSQKVSSSNGFSASFEIDPFRKHCLLNGLDDIGLTLQYEASISQYEQDRNKRMPFLAF